jgi:exopolysaccharide production protein ExoQ
MSASVVRIGTVLHVGRRPAWLVAVSGLLCVAAVSAVVTRQGMLPVALGSVILAITALIGFRWPLVPLIAFAALIPIEEVVVIDGFGTLSRVAGILFAATYAAPRLGSLKLAAMPPAGWAFLAWAVISLGWAVNPGVAGARLPTLLQLFIIAFLIADFVVHRPTIVRPVLWAYSLSAAASALIGVQFYVAQGHATARSIAIQGQDPAQFAAVLLPALVFGLYETINGSRRILGGAIAFLATAGIVVSGTRGAWVACAVVILLIVLPQLTPRRRVMLLATITALVAIVFQLPGIADLVVERSANAISTGGAGRTDIWTVGLTIFSSAPLTGVGYANFGVAFTPEVIRASGVGWDWLNRAGAGSHNVVMATLIELGAIGLLLLVRFLGPLVLRRGWGPNALTLQAALASLLTAALFLDILADRKQVWLVIGLAAGLAYLARANAQKASTRWSASKSDPTWDGWVRNSTSTSGSSPGYAPGRPGREGTDSTGGDRAVSDPVGAGSARQPANPARPPIMTPPRHPIGVVATSGVVVVRDGTRSRDRATNEIGSRAGEVPDVADPRDPEVGHGNPDRAGRDCGEDQRGERVGHERCCRGAEDAEAWDEDQVGENIHTDGGDTDRGRDPWPTDPPEVAAEHVCQAHGHGPGQ